MLGSVPCNGSTPRPSAPHVRSTDAVVLATLARGSAHSATFRRLLEQLEMSDVIVHVERRPRWERPHGATRFIAATPYARYLRITIAATDASDAIVALLGHELRHAVETADAPEVVDESSFHALYRRIGHASCAPPQWCFDTATAVRTGIDVYTELRRVRRSARLSSAQHHERQGDD